MKADPLDEVLAKQAVETFKQWNDRWFIEADEPPLEDPWAFQVLGVINYQFYNERKLLVIAASNLEDSILLYADFEKPDDDFIPKTIYSEYDTYYQHIWDSSQGWGFNNTWYKEMPPKEVKLQ